MWNLALKIISLLILFQWNNLLISHAQDTWTQKANFGGSVRNGATAFSIGSKGYMGLGSYSETSIIYYKDFWEYDPQNNAWTQKADFGGSARTLATGFSIGNKGYIGTGEAVDGFKKDFLEYDPDVNSWIQKANFGGTTRARAVGFSIGSKGYMGTGDNIGVYYKDFWEYNSVNDTWIQKSDFGGGERTGTCGFSIGLNGYVGTGYQGGQYYKDFWEYDAISDAWSQKTDFGGSARIDATAFVIANKGYIGTGNFDPPKNDFWEYDPITNMWVQKADFGGTPRFGADGFSISGKGYIGTGYDVDSYTNDFWEYTPSEVACNMPTSLSTVDITSTSAEVQWDAISEAIAYQVFYKPENSSAYIVIRSPNNDLVITGLTANTKYGWKVKSVCSKSPLITSDFSEPGEFTTSPIRLGTFDQPMFELYPNPVSQSATLSFFLSEESLLEIEITDLRRRLLRVIDEKNFPAGNNCDYSHNESFR